MYSFSWLNEAANSASDHVFFLPFFSFSEAVDETSHDDIREAIYQALKAITPQKDGYYSWVHEVFDSYLIYQEETPAGSKLYRRNYSINEEDEALLGPASEVKEVTEYVPVSDGVREAASEVEVMGKIIPLVERSVRPDGTVPVKIIEPGWGSSAYYPADVLERDGPEVFPAGTHMYWDHMTESEEIERPENELDNLAAVLETPARWEAQGAEGPGLYADARVFDPFTEKLDALAPHIGVSIHTKGMAESGEAEGREGYVLTELLKTPHTSVDYVTKPGAGGQVLSLFESARPRPRKVPMEKELLEAQEKLTAAETQIEELKGKADLTEAERTELARLREVRLVEAATAKASEQLKDTDLSDVTKSRVIESVSKNPPVTEEGELDEAALSSRVDKAAQSEAEYLESVSKSGAIRDMGSNGGGEGDGKKRLEEAVRRLHPEYTDEQISIYVNG